MTASQFSGERDKKDITEPPPFLDLYRSRSTRPLIVTSLTESRKETLRGMDG